MADWGHQDVIPPASTLKLTLFKYKPIGLIWTRATDVDLFWGSWKGHNIIFLGGQNIKVTSPHLMITWKDGQSYIIRADQVHVGDKMKVGNILMSVEKIENYVIKSKVAVETEDGTIRVNDVLASGVCDHNPQAVETIVHTDQGNGARAKTLIHNPTPLATTTPRPLNHARARVQLLSARAH